MDDPKTRVKVASTADLDEEIAKFRSMNAALEAQLARLEEKSSGGGISKQDLQDVLASNTEAHRRAMKPENLANMTPIGAFNPTGSKDKPKLIGSDGKPRKTFYVGSPMREDQLNPDEILLFNRFTADKDSRNGRWTARVIRNGSSEELHIDFPHKEISDRMDLPSGQGESPTSCELILRELLDGPNAVNSNFLAERVASLERQLAASAS